VCLARDFLVISAKHSPDERSIECVVDIKVSCTGRGGNFMQAVLEQKLMTGGMAKQPTDEKIRKVGFLSSLFGCWHPRLTRPISDNHTTYQTCVQCGARRHYDTDTFKPTGSFYYPAKIDPNEALSV
jgi:hypothetical protein